MYPFERFTEEAKKVLTLAQEEAERSHHSYIGTEHLLLAMLRHTDGPGGQALRTLGIETARVRQTIEFVLGRSEPVLFQQIIPTSRVKRVIEYAFEESRREGNNYVDSGHMLVALMLEGEGIAAHVLKDLGATMKKIKTAVTAVRKEPPAVVAGRSGADTETETLLGLLQRPRLARLMQSQGLAVEAVVDLLSRPPEEVVKLRGFVAGLRAEMKAMVEARDYEKASRLQHGERDLLRRLAEAEQAWIDGLQPR
jgi:ATP-dependent Clp protease ATP-binding subunit ClpC